MEARTITELQQRLTTEWHEQPVENTADGFLGLITGNHQQNFLLWHEEDKARRDDLGSQAVHRAKRAIDGYNQKRNDLIEKMDQHLVAELQPREDGVPFNSETPGMIIDRLSILALKEFHMAEEVTRDDATADHRTRCETKLMTIRRQRADLANALAELLTDVAAGRRSFRVYFQFKMYNDVELNPELRRNKAA
ncbi:DUF4254 domain-containing protein [bacterium]|nr:DUF4254 domain-containing protein [bacterium]